MQLNDALTITILGLAVVFVGLILTNLMIYSFSLLPKLSQWFSRTKASSGSTGTVESSDLENRPATSPVTTASPDIMAVITTVLEVELRLRASLVEGKFTFK